MNKVATIDTSIAEGGKKSRGVSAENPKPLPILTSNPEVKHLNEVDYDRIKSSMNYKESNIGESISTNVDKEKVNVSSSSPSPLLLLVPSLNQNPLSKAPNAVSNTGGTNRDRLLSVKGVNKGEGGTLVNHLKSMVTTTRNYLMLSTILMFMFILILLLPSTNYPYSGITISF